MLFQKVIRAGPNQGVPFEGVNLEQENEIRLRRG
jgi:hypothetical protein